MFTTIDRARVGASPAQDRLVSYGPWTFTYTANGELASKTDTTTGQTWTYTYDVAGNLLNMTLPDGRFIEYITDGRHRRIAEKVNGAVVRRWVYQGQLNPSVELDGTGALLYRYAYGSMAHSPDFVVNASGETYRVIRDQLGSPLLVVNIHDEDDVLLEARYSAFGQRTVVDGDGAALTLGFAGGIYDEDTGLTRFGARDYDPVLGRWTAKDPILWDGGTTNLYVYSAGEPVNYIDVSGEFLIPAVAIGAVAAAAGLAYDAWMVWQRATQDTMSKFPDDSLHNGVGDAYKHCLASCWLSQHQGSALADIWGRANESKGNALGQPPEEELMDLQNDACGRSYSEDGNCQSSCQEALDGNILEVLQ